MAEIDDNDTMICYCFGYTADEIAQDAGANGRSAIMARIRNAKRSKTCRCAQVNPKGG